MVVPAEDDAEDLYEHAPCGYLTTVPDGTIVRANQTFLDWTGLERDDLVGKRRFADLLTAGGRIYHETHFAPLLHMQGAVREIAVEVRRADGTRLPVLVNATLKVDDAGEPLLVRVTVFNATDRQRYERELLLARRRAEESEASLRILQQLAARFAAAVEPVDIAAAMVTAAGDLFEHAVARVWLVEERQGRQFLAVAPADEAYSWPALERDMPLPPTRAWRDAAQVVIEDVDDPDLDPEVLAAMRKAGRGAAIASPLFGRDGVLGVVAYGFNAPRQFSADERALLHTLGQQAGQALERAQLFQAERRGRDRAEALQRLSAVLAGTFDRDAIARAVVDQMVGDGAADVAVFGLTVTTDGLRVSAFAGCDEATARDLLAGVDDDLDQRGPGEDVLVIAGPAVDSAGLVDGAAGERLILPVLAGANRLGVLVVQMPPESPFAGEGSRYLGDVATRVALVLEQARLYEQERSVAHTLQRSLLAGDPPRDPRFAVVNRYRPAVASLEVGGDWYDTFPLSESVIGFIVGDVVGRGIDAATAMGQLRSAVRALAGAGLGPARVVDRLDAFVDQVEGARMATLIYAELDLRTGCVKFARAGHPPPVLVSPGEPATLVWDAGSTPLGAVVGTGPRGQAEVVLQPGARLMLFTDGLFERRGMPLDVGLQHVVDAVEARRHRPLAVLVDEVTDVLLVDEQGEDDVCVLCLSFGAAEVWESIVAAEPQALRPLRADLRAWLTGRGVDEADAQAILLAVGEAAANAVEHAYRGRAPGSVFLRAEHVDDAIELTVRDEGTWWEGPAAPDGGRGLRLIEMSSESVEIDRSAGTTVRMRRGLHKGSR